MPKEWKKFLIDNLIVLCFDHQHSLGRLSVSKWTFSNSTNFEGDSTILVFFNNSPEKKKEMGRENNMGDFCILFCIS